MKMTVSLKENDHWGILKIKISESDERSKIVRLPGESLFPGQLPSEQVYVLVPIVYIETKGYTIKFALEAIDKDKLAIWKGGFDDEPTK